MSLAECCLGDTDKGVHGYLPFYERHLVPEEIGTLTEIGVYNGGSLRMWARWLPHARIIGIDIEPANFVPDGNPNIEFIAGDATTLMPQWTDVVIDDGSHHGDEQAETFGRFWTFLNPGGWYVIEDLETIWGNGFRAAERIWRLINQQLANVLHPGHSVSEFHAYEQILFVRKR